MAQVASWLSLPNSLHEELSSKYTEDGLHFLKKNIQFHLELRLTNVHTHITLVKGVGRTSTLLVTAFTGIFISWSLSTSTSPKASIRVARVIFLWLPENNKYIIWETNQTENSYYKVY